ncbi:MAG: hypothetical protein ACTS73_02555 [Arsenophonus sp. NEOnobi-MAG3]
MDFYPSLQGQDTPVNAQRFLRDLNRACPIAIHQVFIDNGKKFIDRLFDLRKRSATKIGI